MAITKITTPELFDFSATNTALQLPTGDTASRPSAPSAGEWRFNSEEKYVEYWDGGSPGAWRQIDTDAPANPDDFPSQNFNVNTYTGTGATQAIDAKFNEAAYFDGSTSQITLPDSIGTAMGNNNFSVSFWVYVNDASNDEIYLSITRPYDFYIRKFSSGSIYLNLGTLSYDTGVSLSTGWHHIAVTKSSSSGSILYLDNNATADASKTGNITANSIDNSIGNYNGGSFVVDGKIDQVRIFNTALTSLQVTDLYNNETTTTAATLNFPAGAGCVAAYQLDGDASDVGGTYGGVETDIGYTGLRFQPDMVWIKSRSNSSWHVLHDSVRGAVSRIFPNESNAASTSFDGFVDFESNGFSLDGAGSGGDVNASGRTYVAWCFNAGGAPTATNSAGAGNVPTAGSVKIDGADSTTALAGTIAATKISANTKTGFSIVSYTGNGTAGATVGHELSAAPELYIVKRLNASYSWVTYVQTLGNTKYLDLNNPGPAYAYNFWNSTDPTPTVFSLSSETGVNGNTDTHIAYCFHSVAGYQKVGTYTGSNSTSGPIVYTTDDGTATGTGGFEPAFLLIKGTQSTTQWLMIDNKRSTSNPRNKALFANLADTEGTNNSIDFFTNGFQPITTDGDSNRAENYIYLAIAADKDTSVPTQANSFSPTIYNGNGGTQNIYIPFAPDFVWAKQRNGSDDNVLFDTVRGPNKEIISNSTGAEANKTDAISSFNSNSFVTDANGALNASGSTYVSWNWKAGGLPTINSDGTIPSIVSANVAAGFSIVSYTGNGSSSADVGHGLASIPELCIFKQRSSGGTSGGYWNTYLTAGNKVAFLNETNAFVSNTAGTNGTIDIANMNATKFGFLNGSSSVNNQNNSGSTYIAYFFTSKSGYQKVGTYTGSGTSDFDINVGFTPRFLLIKCISDSGTDWAMSDTARNPGTTPYYAYRNLYANLANQEGVTSPPGENSYVEIRATGFGFTAAMISAGTNTSYWANGQTFMYLAIA